MLRSKVLTLEEVKEYIKKYGVKQDQMDGWSPFLLAHNGLKERTWNMLYFQAGWSTAFALLWGFATGLVIAAFFESVPTLYVIQPIQFRVIWGSEFKLIRLFPP